MPWIVHEHPEFIGERETLPEAVQDRLAEVILAIEEHGPDLGRPMVDTLNGSRHGNMKEIRFRQGGLWRFAFAFDPDRDAVVLVGGNKDGANQKQFYKRLIKTADR
ncbi:MAG TPA: type II toxin-antitoxin system RelE/ParE family toxin, partial [Devosia sp.]